MTAIMTFAATAAVCAALAMPVSGTAWETEYLDEMVCAVVEEDYSRGEAAAQARNEMLQLLQDGEGAFEFEELLLLSRIMYAEAGSEWLSDEWKMCVGEVVLNRAASPEFPDTIREVLEQPGQYYGKNCRYFDTLQPSERCVRLAIRLLQGERVMNEPSVVFQANFRQGGGVFAEYKDDSLGSTYFCCSVHPELYAAIAPREE